MKDKFCAALALIIICTVVGFCIYGGNDVSAKPDALDKARHLIIQKQTCDELGECLGKKTMMVEEFGDIWTCRVRDANIRVDVVELPSVLRGCLITRKYGRSK